MAKDDKDKASEPSDIFSGALNIFGLKLDLGDLLDAPEKLSGSLEALREKLKQAGGKEALSDEDWKSGGVSVSGHIRTRGIRGEEEYHIGTAGRPRTGRPRKSEQPAPEPPEVLEPPIDVFDEGPQITIVADVPGVSLDEMELKVEGRVFSLSTKASTRRNYSKELHLEADVDPGSLRAACHNGVLEVQLRKRETESSGT